MCYGIPLGDRFVLPSPSSAPRRGAARVIWLLILWHRTVCFCHIFSAMHAILFYVYMRFQLCTPPFAGLWVVPPFHLALVSPFRLDPRHDDGLREGFDVGCRCRSACVSFNSPFFFSLPRHGDGSREVFGGGLPHHSAFAFRPPPATLAVRGRFLTVV